MANRDNHYEVAFEAYLRLKQIPYVAVDETKRGATWRCLTQEFGFHCLDDAGSFVVGRRERPTLSRGHRSDQKQYWKNWSTRDDVRSLTAWQRLFGPAFCGLFVFAYEIVGDRAPLAADQLFEHRGRLYGFLGVRLDDYAARAHAISAKWDTLSMTSRQFRSLAVPVEELFCRMVAPEFGRQEIDPQAGFELAESW